MRTFLMLALAGLLAACGGGNEGAGSSGSSSRDSDDRPSNKASAGNGAATDPVESRDPDHDVVATPLPELFVDGWYRAPGGVAIVQFPELPEGWTLKYTEGSSGRIVTIGREGAFAVFTFLPPNSTDVTDLKLAQVLAVALAQSVLKEAPHMKSTRSAAELEHAGGYCSAQFMEGKNAQGVDETCIVAAVADGKEAALCMCQTRKSLLDAAWNNLAAKVLEGVRVGKHVPKLPAQDPGKALSGVYQGPTDFGATANDNTEYWMVFDKRGWCHECSPGNELELELDAMYQWRPDLCLRYRVSAGKLEITTADGKPRKTYKCEVKKDRLVLDGDNWWYMNRSDPIQLDGYYEAFTYYVNPGYGSTFTFSSSKNYWFTKDGRFSFESSSMSTLTDDPGWPASDGFRDWAHAYSETPKNYGHYRIVNNVLQLLFADGRRSAKTIFLAEGSDPGMLYIAGSVYLKEG